MSESTLHVETTASGDDDSLEAHAVRVVARGEVDTSSAAKLLAQLEQLIEGGARLILFDAKDVHFMDSSGLRVIVAVGNQLSAHGGRLLIEGMSGAVQRVLEVAGLLESYRDAPTD